MAINKDKNVNLQITISKYIFENLEKIQEELIKETCLPLTKSQVITILISKFSKSIEATEKEPQKEETNESAPNYSALVMALKNKLKATFSQLEEITEIPQTTLKKYSGGEQKPRGENEKKLIDAFKKYGIM